MMSSSKAAAVFVTMVGFARVAAIQKATSRGQEPLGGVDIDIDSLGTNGSYPYDKDKQIECLSLKGVDSWPPVDPSNPPAWWAPEGSVHPQAGAKIAIAFRGDYRRFKRDGFSHCKGPACSDYWANKDNIEKSLFQPLRSVGANLRIYFHTFGDASCPHHDASLLRDLKPSKYKFDAEYHDVGFKGLEYTYIEVMKLVIEDNWADYALLVRFDVQYHAPITSWKMQWGKFNYQYASPKPWKKMVNDLIYTVPKKWFGLYLEALTNKTIRTEEAIKFMPERNAIQIGFTELVRDCSAHYHECPI